MEKYVTKITADGDGLAWLRPVTAETHLMTVVGVAREGWAEASPLGGYVRFSGTFHARFQPRPDRDGVISAEAVLLTSNRLILPAVGANFIGEYFERDVVEVGIAKGADATDKSARNRTGEHFFPRVKDANGTPGVVFAIDLLLQPPKEGKPSNTGYQFGAVIKARPALDALSPSLLAMVGIETRPLLEGRTADIPPADDEAAQTAAA